MSRSAPRSSGGVYAGSFLECLLLATVLSVVPAAQGVAQTAPVNANADGQASSVSAPDSTWLVQDSIARACLDTLSDGSVRPVTVYQVAAASDTSPAVLDQVALISERVGERVRAALGGGTGAVPNVDSLVPWRRLAGRVPIRIVLHRDAAATWAVDGSAGPTKAKLATLYAAVLRSMPDDALDVVLPAPPAPDSVLVWVTLTSSESSIRPLPRPGYPMVAVFRMSGVAFTPAIARRNNPVPAYPLDAAERRIGADVVVGLVVRPGGRADAEVRTIVISSPEPMDARAHDHFAREFRSAVEGVVKEMRFEPARIGGCVVPQRADFPFSFRRG